MEEEQLNKEKKAVEKGLTYLHKILYPKDFYKKIKDEWKEIMGRK